MSTAAPHLTLPVGKRDHILGHETAPITLVEYGDFECPHCGRAHPIVRELRRRLGDELRFVFRHFPLANIHPNAEPAAEAAEAAGAQGRFWEMHDWLFDHQDSLDADSLLTCVRALGLDVDRFATELRDGIHMPRVREDFSSGVRSGVNGTPTFFINGARHDGGYDLVSLTRGIELAREPHLRGGR
jgi:protein-disulfide isomerase